MEPAGLSRSDSKRPDDVTIAPWKLGHPLVWDVTCPDTFATSYEIQATSEAGAVAALVERKKKTKYKAVAQTHLFYPIAIETSGVFGQVAQTHLFYPIAIETSGVFGQVAQTHLLYPIAIETSGVFGQVAYEILCIWLTKSKPHPTRHTFSNKYLLRCREAAYAASVRGCTGLDLHVV